MKIYIIGPSGGGKTTLANHLSKKYNIPTYELDCVVYDDDHGNVRRSDEEIQKIFKGIIRKKDWIIEDIGRDKFNEGLEKCDTIYYLKISQWVVYGRVIRRWFRQRIGKEKYNYPPTILQFFDMLRVAIGYFTVEKKKLAKLNNYKDKLVFIKNKELQKILREGNENE
ncbi:MAG: AAA family ATPase [Bacilli bacterium]|nr:AAA family ATPase [Bacilli bacterium]